MTNLLALTSQLGFSRLPLFFFNHPATTEIYTLSLHDALPISRGHGRDLHRRRGGQRAESCDGPTRGAREHVARSEEHTSELQSRENLVCRLLLEKKKKTKTLISNPDKRCKQNDNVISPYTHSS